MIVSCDSSCLSFYRVNLLIIIKVNAMQNTIGEADNLLYIARIAAIGKQTLYVVVDGSNPALNIVCSNDHVLCMLLNIGGGIRPSCSISCKQSLIWSANCGISIVVAR